MMILSGVALVAGFLSVLAGSAIALGVIGMALGWFLSPAAGLFDPSITTGLVVVVATYIVLLGPGALSVDARLFGFREIVIPRSPKH